MVRVRRMTGFLAAVVLTVMAVTASAQQQTASQFYMQYRAAFDKAKAIEDLLPFMSAPRRKQMEATPAAERAKMFEVFKLLGTMTQVKITKETRTADGAVLTVEGLDSDKAKTVGEITLVRENDAWKLDKESFKSS
jgi:heme/copper-type cytochrome/quinol oxidase subunit 4